MSNKLNQTAVVLGLLEKKDSRAEVKVDGNTNNIAEIVKVIEGAMQEFDSSKSVQVVHILEHIPTCSSSLIVF